MKTVENHIQAINKLRDQHQYSEAWDMVEKLCASSPDETAYWRAGSYLASHQQAYSKAAGYMSQAIALMPHEPAFYFKRARDYLQAGNCQAAIVDADTVLDISKQNGSDYYTDTALFYKAEALYRLGRSKEAYAIALALPPETGHWLGDAMRTCKDIVEACRHKEIKS